MISSGKPVLRALRGETLAPPPFWLMRQAGRYLPEYRALREKAGSFLGLCYQPALAAEATLQPIRRFGMDAAILFSDILLVPQALGQNLAFAAGEGPTLTPVRTREAALALRPDGATGRLAPVYQAMARVAAALPADKTLIGFAGAPWTVATYMVEGGSSRSFSHIKEWALGDEKGFAVLLDRLIVATSAHLSAQIEAGAEVVQLFDTWAGIVPSEAFERLVIAPTRRIVETLRNAHPDVPVIGFPRGIGALHARYFDETRVDALSLDATVTLPAATALQARGPVQGNLDPQLLVTGGEAMEAAGAAVPHAVGGGPFFFNLGPRRFPGTPGEHVSRPSGFGGRG